MRCRTIGPSVRRRRQQQLQRQLQQLQRQLQQPQQQLRRPRWSPKHHQAFLKGRPR